MWLIGIYCHYNMNIMFMTLLHAYKYTGIVVTVHWITLLWVDKRVWKIVAWQNDSNLLSYQSDDIVTDL